MCISILMSTLHAEYRDSSENLMSVVDKLGVLSEFGWWRAVKYKETMADGHAQDALQFTLDDEKKRAAARENMRSSRFWRESLRDA